MKRNRYWAYLNAEYDGSFSLQPVETGARTSDRDLSYTLQLS